jgi:hypothetical protein
MSNVRKDEVVIDSDGTIKGSGSGENIRNMVFQHV